MKQHRNTLMIQEVAEGLGELKDRVAFVGGATTALYIDDKLLAAPTPSDDVDFVVELASMHEYSMLEEVLRKKGFKDPPPDDEKTPPICRKIYKGIQVDVMPTEEKILNFCNRWYAEAMKHREKISLPNGECVFIFNIVYFLATKLEAFKDRGKGDEQDIRFSHDLEDILSILDGCSYVEEKMKTADTEVSEFIKSEFKALLKDDDLLEEAASGFIRDSVRARRVVERVRNLAK